MGNTNNCRNEGRIYEEMIMVGVIYLGNKA